MRVVTRSEGEFGMFLRWLVYEVDLLFYKTFLLKTDLYTDEGEHQSD